MSEDQLPYDKLMEEALRGVIRRALSVVAEQGLRQQHHFYVTFRTDLPGVVMPDHLRRQHPQEITIVIQHQFWGLEAGEREFAVTLSFDGKQERLVVPLSAISAFVDPSVQFGLQFPSVAVAPAAKAEASEPDAAPEAADAEKPAAEASAKVVTLDAFRKK